MTECEKYEEMISTLLDGELSRDDASALRDHLQQCSSCRQAYRDYSAVSNYTRMLPDEAPFVLSSKVMIQAEGLPAPAAAAEPAKPAKPARRKQHRSPLRFILPLAAACLILVIGFTAVKNIHRVGSTQSAEAAVTESTEFETAAEDAAAADDTPAEPVMVFDAEIDKTDETSDSSSAQDTAEIPSYIIPDELGSEFESIITVGDGNIMDPSELTALCYAEYHGVVYEFLTNDDQSSLYWLDAAEGVDAIYSGASAADLFAILDTL